MPVTANTARRRAEPPTACRQLLAAARVLPTARALTRPKQLAGVPFPAAERRFPIASRPRTSIARTKKEQNRKIKILC